MEYDSIILKVVEKDLDDIFQEGIGFKDFEGWLGKISFKLRFILQVT